MAVVICSKYEIKNSELFMLDNPNLVYSVDSNITYYSHDKGFIIATIRLLQDTVYHFMYLKRIR